MLLTIDCGNTQLVVGVYEGNSLLGTWRFRTDVHRTEDEYAVLLRELLRTRDLEAGNVDGMAACSVVPGITLMLSRLCEKYLHVEPLFVDYNTPLGMPVLLDSPRELGPDRIVNGFAGYRLYGGPLIIVDFGTATNFDCVSASGAFLGGALAPGVEISNEALFARASRLSSVAIYKPMKALGTNTADCLRSGIIWGFAGQVDGIVEKLREELPGARVIATGGLAERIAPFTKTVEEVDKELTLKGLKIIYDYVRA